MRERPPTGRFPGRFPARPSGIWAIMASRCFSIQHRRHRRLDVSRRDRIDGDAARSHLARQRPGHSDQPGLRGGVVHLARLPGAAHHAGDVDDASPAILSMGRSSAWVSRNAPVRLVLSTSSQSGRFMRSTSPSRVMPALLTRISTLPKSLEDGLGAGLDGVFAGHVQRKDRRLAARRLRSPPPFRPAWPRCARPAPPWLRPAPVPARKPAQFPAKLPSPAQFFPADLAIVPAFSRHIGASQAPCTVCPKSFYRDRGRHRSGIRWMQDCFSGIDGAAGSLDGGHGFAGIRLRGAHGCSRSSCQTYTASRRE